VITGRGPGAPGVPPGLDVTRRPGTPGGPASEAVDLGEIRRSEEAIDRLAARGAAGPELIHDPALALLAALRSDVNTPSTRPGPLVPGLARRQGRPRRAALAGSPSRGVAAWLRTALAGAVLAGLASSASLLCASMLGRLARGPGRRGQLPSGGWAGRPARGRRLRLPGPRPAHCPA
jgi:hypothetical protein